MSITPQTTMAEVCLITDLFSPVDEARLMLASETYFCAGGGWWGMTIADFCAVAGGDVSFFGVVDGAPQTYTVFAHYAVKSFGVFVNDFLEVTKKLEPPTSAREKAAASACLPMELAEGLLTFTRSYFGLHSFDEAGRLPLSDYLLAKKDAYNKAVFERSVANAMKVG